MKVLDMSRTDFLTVVPSLGSSQPYTRHFNIPRGAYTIHYRPAPVLGLLAQSLASNALDKLTSQIKGI